MERADVLQTIAEVATAFAGFAAIVFAVRSRGGALVAGDRLRLQVMLGSSLSTVAFSFVPLWLLQVGVAPSTTWGLSSGLIVLYLGIMVPRDIRQQRRISVREAADFGGRSVVAVLAVAALLSQLINATGLVWGRSFGGFLGGLILLLALSGFAFFRLVAFSSPDPE